MSFLSPKEILEQISKSGSAKVETNTSKVLILSFLAGAYIAFAGFLAIKIGGGLPAIEATNPGLAKLIFAGVFPVGLMFVIMAGAELFTGNTALLIPALKKRDIKWQNVAKNWSLSFLGNFIGSVFVAYFFVYQTELLHSLPWRNAVHNIAEAKVSGTFTQLFLKGIACNWLVCLGIWLALASNQVSGKILGIWFPIMTFVALGFEHSIANMFFVPIAIFEGAKISWLQFLFDNLLPVTLGNIIGGAFFVGGLYSYVYLDRTKVS